MYQILKLKLGPQEWMGTAKQIDNSFQTDYIIMKNEDDEKKDEKKRNKRIKKK